MNAGDNQDLYVEDEEYYFEVYFRPRIEKPEQGDGDASSRLPA